MFDNIIRFMFWTNDKVSAFRRAMVILPSLFLIFILSTRIGNILFIPLFLFSTYLVVTFVYVIHILTDSDEKLLKYYIFRPFNFSNSILDFRFYYPPIKKDKKVLYSVEFELLGLRSTNCILVNDERLWNILKSIKVTDEFFCQYGNLIYGDANEYNLTTCACSTMFMTSNKILYSKLKLISK